jgi:hypothetical protein
VDLNWKGIVMMFGGFLLFAIGGFVLINRVSEVGGGKSTLEPLVHAAAPTPVVVSFSDSTTDDLIASYLKVITTDFLPVKRGARKSNFYGDWFRAAWIIQKLGESCRMSQKWDSSLTEDIAKTPLPDLELQGRTPEEATKFYKSLTWQEQQVFGACYKALHQPKGRDIEP